MKKKQLFATLLMAISVSTVMAQSPGNDTSYDINGTCTDDTKLVYVIDILKSETPVDSTATNGGKFQLKGKSSKNAILLIAAKDSKKQLLFINDGTPVTADITSETVKGSELNNKLNAAVKQMNEIDMERQKYINQFKAAQESGKSEAELKALAEELSAKHINPLDERAATLAKKIVYENLDNVIPALFVNRIIDACEFEELKKLFDTKNAFTTHPFAAQAKAYVNDMAKKREIIGTQFKDLEMNDTDGKTHKLSEYCGKGNYVLIDFWASWCGPCRAEMPNVKANYDKYHSKGFEIVGLSFDNKNDAWKKAIDEMGMKWINLSDLQGWKSIAAKVYNIRSIPSSLLIDPEGKVVDIDLRAEKLGERLKAIYGF